MSDLNFTPFEKQAPVLMAPFQGKRFIGAFAGKRAGKTEIGAIVSGMLQEKRPNYTAGGVDPYLGIISAPTYDMLRRLSWKKFEAYWRPFIGHKTKTPMEMVWHDSEDGNESLIYGISADKPGRLEGVKANWIWIDEVFQVSEQFFLECCARVADQEGFVICTGSLGVQFINPKQHWAYKYFKETNDDTYACFEWATLDNPYFPKREIERLKRTLDEQTFNAMFTITWDLTPKSAVYHNWSEANEITGYEYNPNLPLYICVDWGWTHPMSCGFYQYDIEKDHVIKFDEIFGSRMTIDDLYKKILAKPYIKTIKKIEPASYSTPIAKEYDYVTNATWICDMAGKQEREQTGRSNVAHMRKKYGILFKMRKSKILPGVAIVRSYIKSATGEVRFFVDVDKCPETVDGHKRYRFPEKDGIIQSENPVKVDDDSCDETRYFFWNMLDPSLKNRESKTIRL